MQSNRTNDVEAIRVALLRLVDRGSLRYPAGFCTSSFDLRRVAAKRKREIRRLQGIVLATIEEVQRIEAKARELESEGR